MKSNKGVKKARNSDERQSDKKKFRLRNCIVLIKKSKFKIKVSKTIATVSPETKMLMPQQPLDVISNENKSELRIVKAFSMASNKSLSIEEFSENWNETKKPQVNDTNKQELTSTPAITKTIVNTKTVVNTKTIEKKMPEKKLTKPKEVIIDVTQGRSKRIPKPNRKYLNDQLISPFTSKKDRNNITSTTNIPLSDSDSDLKKLESSSSDIDSDILREQDSDDSSMTDIEIQAKPKSKQQQRKLKSNRIEPSSKFAPKIVTNVYKEQLITEALQKSKNQLSGLSQIKRQSQKSTMDVIPQIRSIYNQESGKTIIFNRVPNAESKSNTYTIPKTQQQQPKQLQMKQQSQLKQQKQQQELRQQQNLQKQPRQQEQQQPKSQQQQQHQQSKQLQQSPKQYQSQSKQLQQQQQLQHLKFQQQQLKQQHLKQQHNQQIKHLQHQQQPQHQQQLKQPQHQQQHQINQQQQLKQLQQEQPKPKLPLKQIPTMGRKRKVEDEKTPKPPQKKIIELPDEKDDIAAKLDKIFESDTSINDENDFDDTLDIDNFIKQLNAQRKINLKKKQKKAANVDDMNQQDTMNPVTSENKATIVQQSQSMKQTTNVKEKLDCVIEKSESPIQKSKERSQEITSKINDMITGSRRNEKLEKRQMVLEESSSSESEDEDSRSSKDSDGNPLDDTNSQLEDFEKMPTFTIVNINDIIGKKDAMLEKLSSKDPLKSSEDTNSLPSSDESEREEIYQRNRRIENKDQKSSKLVSHRKSKIKDQQQASPSKAGTTYSRRKSSPQQNVKILNNNLKLSKSVSSSNKKNEISKSTQNKGPPRILNSMVAKKTSPITTFNTKVNTRRSTDDFSESDNDTPTSSITARGSFKQKENNVISNQHLKQSNEENKVNNAQKSQLTQQQPQSSAKRKLPSEKVVVQRQGNKIIKKITCFETWYVINLPTEATEKENFTRNILAIPLIQLANKAKSIHLPSSKWTLKISLQKCSPSQLLNRIEPYTGEIYDDYISPDDVHKYQPSNVMFRRQSLHPTPKVPYDRAVIFKNNTYFTNIEGKNVRLDCAPSRIESIEEIQILLDLVNEFTLRSEFVEQTPYIP